VVVVKLVDLKSPSDVKDVGDDGDDDYGVGVGFGGFNPFEDDEEFKIFGELSEKEVTSIFNLPILISWEPEELQTFFLVLFIF
jgi:hypothetical protein